MRPRAFVVHQLHIVADEDAAVAAMTAPAFNQRTTAVKEATAGEAVGTAHRGEVNSDDRVKVTTYTAEKVTLSAQLESPGWLILTDTYYPGWQATVNGQPTEIIPVNILFRGIELPAGDNEIIFEFKPDSVRNGALISSIALVALVAALLYGYFGKRFKTIAV